MVGVLSGEKPSSSHKARENMIKRVRQRATHRTYMTSRTLISMNIRTQPRTPKNVEKYDMSFGNMDRARELLQPMILLIV